MKAPVQKVVRQSTEKEDTRLESLLSLLPRGHKTVLDLGARDGWVSQHLVNYFDQVVALDLTKPALVMDRVVCVQGDATRLQYPDNSFDTVVCAEVLEHIPDVQKACDEITRVARYNAVIGVPYRQDLRLNATTCGHCGRTNPPYGHLHSFDEKRLAQLFPGMSLARFELVGPPRVRTNAVSSALMTWAKHPWGAYGTHRQPCIHCKRPLTAPQRSTILQRAAAKAAFYLDGLQQTFTRHRSPTWIHALLHKANTGFETS
jgi:SAM-dependent methyltransferase